MRTSHQAKALLAAALTCLLLSGCNSGDASISAQVEALLKARPATHIDLAQIGPASWERICVLKPYTTNAHAEQVLGFAWDAERNTSIAGNEGINVLVFTRGREVAAYTEHPRSKGDFSRMQPSCLPRTRAIVIREQMSNGWVFLVSSQLAHHGSTASDSSDLAR